MPKHINNVIPSFLVTHLYNSNDKLYLLGYILDGQQKGRYFGVEYHEITQEEFINSRSDESCIYFNYDNKYYCLQVGYSNTDTNYFSPDIQNNLSLIKDNFPNGEFRYAKYMNCVAYIIMTGMIITGI